jgi:hypothetical protein
MLSPGTGIGIASSGRGADGVVACIVFSVGMAFPCGS